MQISRAFVSVLFVVFSVSAFSREKKTEFGTPLDKELVAELIVSPFKVYIESEEPGYAPAGYFEKQAAWKIISRPEIAQRVSIMCENVCQVTIKKEAADYIVMFAAGQGAGSKNWSWITYENDGGVEVKNGQTLVFNNAIKDALLACYLNIRNKRIAAEREATISSHGYYLYSGGAEAAAQAAGHKPLLENKDEDQPTGGARLQESIPRKN